MEPQASTGGSLVVTFHSQCSTSPVSWTVRPAGSHDVQEPGPSPHRGDAPDVSAVKDSFTVEDTSSCDLRGAGSMYVDKNGELAFYCSDKTDLMHEGQITFTEWTKAN